MNQIPLLSIIVPCYNVETYADKCIGSIVAQQYSNLEIILIDDGSTDMTGAICDAWQERDSRIRVIHKANEGSSFARKTGIEYATAEYVTFVDADDWIDENMYVDLITVLLSTNSDIAQCGVCDVYEDGRIHHRSFKGEEGAFQIFGRIEGVLLILRDQTWKSYMWNKIFKKTLFNQIVFPRDMVYCEDFVMMHELFHRSSQTVFLNKNYYFYFQRTGSICYPVDLQFKLKKNLDFSDAYFERYSFVEKNPEYHDALPFVKNQVAVTGIRALTYLTIYPQYCDKEYFRAKSKQICAMTFCEKEKLPLRIKIRLELLKISPKLFMSVILFLKHTIMTAHKLNITKLRILE